MVMNMECDWYQRFEVEWEFQSKVGRKFDLEDIAILNTRRKRDLIKSKYMTELRNCIGLALERENLNQEIRRLTEQLSFGLDSCTDPNEVHAYMCLLKQNRDRLSKRIYSIVYKLPSSLQDEFMIMVLREVYKQHFAKKREQEAEKKLTQKIEYVEQKLRELQAQNPLIPIRLTKSLLKRLFPQLNSRQINSLYEKIRAKNLYQS